MLSIFVLEYMLFPAWQISNGLSNIRSAFLKDETRSSCNVEILGMCCVLEFCFLVFEPLVKMAVFQISLCIREGMRGGGSPRDGGI